MKKKMVMIVYNVLRTDARVMRAANSLKNEFDITLIGLGDDDYKVPGIDVVEIELNKKSSNLSRYLDFCHKGFKIIRNGNYDVLYAHDFYSAVFVCMLKRKIDKCIYDAHELIIPEDGKNMSARSNLFYHLEKKALRYTNITICASDERAQLMQEHYQLSLLPYVVKNISVLSNDYVAEDIFSPEFRTFMEKDGYTLVYAGNLSGGRRIETVFNLAINSKNNVKVLIIGDGDAKEKLLKYASEALPGKFLFVGSIPYNMLGAYLSKCDIGFLNYPPSNLNNTFCAPNKVYEYASVGLPIIAEYNPTLVTLIQNTGIGRVASDENDIYECFDDLIDNLDNMKQQCSDFIHNNSWENESKAFRNYVAEHIG
ncbi:MAG: glycosyltransferase [Candidatus Gastranaerophilales bacterium]|nr:glycosyltransferase [Candidatus Gastranaerophilales bacterium]